MASTKDFLGITPSPDSVWPKYSTDLWKNLHFEALSVNPLSVVNKLP